MRELIKNIDENPDIDEMISMVLVYHEELLDKFGENEQNGWCMHACMVLESI